MFHLELLAAKEKVIKKENYLYLVGDFDLYSFWYIYFKVLVAKEKVIKKRKSSCIALVIFIYIYI